MFEKNFNLYTDLGSFREGKSVVPPRSTPPSGSPAEEDPAFLLSLDGKMDFDKVFSVVKATVRAAIKKERSGLGLALSDLPATLGAFWQVGGNYIVMNQVLIDAMTRLTSTPREFNSFIYMILTHEYLHSLGYIDEMEARQMTAVVAKKAFGINHPAYIMSNGDLWSLYPELRTISGGIGDKIKIIGNFDSSSTSYIA